MISFPFAGLQSAPSFGNGLTSAFTKRASHAFSDGPNAAGPFFDINEGSKADLGLSASMLESIVPSVSPLGLSLELNGILTSVK